MTEPDARRAAAVSDAELLANAIARRLQRRLLTGVFRIENDYMPILRRHIQTVIEQSAYTLTAARPAGDQVTISRDDAEMLRGAAKDMAAEYDDLRYEFEAARWHGITSRLITALATPAPGGGPGSEADHD
jgi:hypothetical protein